MTPSREMRPLKVYPTEGGDIAIEQDGWPDDPSLVLFRPEQADLLIQWIRETQAEIQAEAEPAARSETARA